MGYLSNYAGFYQPDVGLREIDFKLVYSPYWTDDNPYEYMKKKFGIDEYYMQ